LATIYSRKLVAIPGRSFDFAQDDRGGADIIPTVVEESLFTTRNAPATQHQSACTEDHHRVNISPHRFQHLFLLANRLIG